MKNKHLLLTLAVIPFLIGCEGIGGEDDEFQATHNQGIDCLQCHSSGEHVFISGATIYKNLNGADYDSANAAQGYSIQLLLDTGTILKYSSGNGYGNLLYNGDQGAINNFTAQIIDAQGNIVNQSANNSHDAGRLACNSCHTQDGLNGAPGRIVNYDYTKSLAADINATLEPTTTSTQKSFDTDIMPILQTCTSCHGTSGNYTVTDANETYSNITSNGFIDTNTPANSILLLKATETVSHEGGVRFNTSSTEYQTISTWITEGALNN